MAAALGIPICRTSPALRSDGEDIQRQNSGDRHGSSDVRGPPDMQGQRDSAYENILWIKCFHARSLDPPLHARRRRRRRLPAERPRGARALPLVQSGGSQGPADLLLGLVCPRMADANGCILPARARFPPRPGRVRAMWSRLREGMGPYPAAAMGQALPRPGRVGRKSPASAQPLGRRPHRAGRGRGRRVRSGESAHPLPEVPLRGDRRAPGAPPEPRSRSFLSPAERTYRRVNSTRRSRFSRSLISRSRSPSRIDLRSCCGVTKCSVSPSTQYATAAQIGPCLVASR